MKRQNNRDYSMLEQDIAILEQIIKISRSLNSTLEMRPLLQQIVESAKDLTNADGASILLMEGEESLQFAAASGPQSKILAITEVPLEGSLAGWVVKNRKQAVVEDAQSDPRHYNIQAIDTTQSIIAVPMIFDDRVIGVLESVTTKERYRFTHRDMDTLETLASIAAVAVQNARLFEQSDWVAEVVHEIRTPLTAILSYADLLHHPNLDNVQREQFASIIQQETQRVNDLATQFLDLARLESGRIKMEQEPLNIPEVVTLSANIIRPTAVEQNRDLKIDIPADIPAILGDKQRIHQVLLNLLSNAVKYSDPGDTVSIQVSLKDEHVIIAVSDTGPGIPEDQLPHLFHKFARLPGSERKATGTGLGLVVARQIVEAHQGKIWAESEIGRGSTFSFSLPLRSDEQEI